MDNSIVLVVWTTPDDRDVTRQIAIPYDIDPLDLDEDEITSLAISQGFNIYGDLSWEVLVDNSRYSYMSEDRRKVVKLREKIDRLISDLQDATNELYEIAHDNGSGYD